jgi:putative ABC transport system ATP-binding protein
MSAKVPPVVALQGVERVYGKGDALVHALRGVDFDIHDGEFVAVMGASGSGKSTCMNVLGCLDVPTGGHYLFRGVDVGSLDSDQLALLRRHYLGFIFQGFNLLKRTSALQNVELPLIYRRVPRKERRERAREALNSVGLSDREDHTPSELSGGQQQRVAIARAIVSQPLLLLADEPTGNLDEARKHDIIELLVKLNQERHITIVMVTHEPEMAAHSSRVIEFRDGRVVRDAAVPARGTDAA